MQQNAISLVDVERVAARHHERDRDLAEPLVGHADDGCGATRRVGGEGVLDLGRGDVEAADHDHVLQPVDDAQPARFVERADVAGVQPAVADRRPRWPSGSSR